MPTNRRLWAYRIIIRFRAEVASQKERAQVSAPKLSALARETETMLPIECTLIENAVVETLGLSTSADLLDLDVTVGSGIGDAGTSKTVGQ